MTEKAPPTVVAWHGETKSLWYVVDPSAPEDEQPCVLETCTSAADARQERFALEKGETTDGP